VGDQLTSLRVRQIKSKLLQLFEQHLDLSDISKNDRERETKILTRCLAAYAIYFRTACSEEDAAKSVWDGADDNGIDAVYHDASESRVVIVQSKWIQSGSGEPEAKDLATFANGVHDVVEDNADNFGRRLHEKLSAVSGALLVPGTTMDVVLITTGASELARHGTVNLDRVLNELNEPLDEDPIAQKVVMGLEEVYKSLANTSNEGITVTATIQEWSVLSQPYAAYFGIIDGLQLKEWWRTYGKRIVAKNIRHALGATDINEAIRKTAISSPEDFWYFNNGITLIAEDVVRAPKGAASHSFGTFEFKDASVVNGAQTISTLARVEPEESLGSVRVGIRVVILAKAPEGFGGEVTRTNNLQNRVEGRDFAAHDPEQARLQQEMAMEGVEYQFLRSGDFVPSPKSCELIEVTTALACAAAEAPLAVNVKTGIGRFFNDLTRAPYKAVFNPTVSGARAFNSTLCLRAIEDWLDQKKAQFGKRIGYPWGTLVHGNRILAAAVFKMIGRQAFDVPIEEFRAKLPSLVINDKCEWIYEGMLAALNTEYPDKVLAVLFKSPVRSKVVFDLAVAQAEQRVKEQSFNSTDGSGTGELPF
jgi:hypothetical protein